MMTKPPANTAIWEALGKTDPKHTKAFTRSGGFKGTAIKPQWVIQRLTKYFGPIGVGWGVEEPQFQLVPAGEELLVFCTATCWHGAPENRLYGVGGDKVLAKNKYGLATDDEAFKKAFTDAITNAFKFLGVGADVHMGQFDDSKYVAQMNQEFNGAREAGGQSDSTVSPRSSNDDDIRWVELVQLIEATGTNTGELLQHYNAPDLNALSAKDAADAVRKLRSKLAKLAFPEGPAPNITTLKQLSGQLYREVAGCGDASELDALLAVPENAALLKQMAALETPAHKELWTGDGKDSPGLSGLISAKEREFATQVPDRVPA